MNLPEEFIIQMQDILGSEYPAFISSLEQDIPVSIRINETKNDYLPGNKNVSWCKTGYYLDARPSFTFDPLFHAGHYYVQEASSMFLEQAVKTFISKPACALDLCAAPGGKSTHLLSVLPQGSLLVSNEVIRSRAHILAENLMKWGNPATIVIQNDPAEIGKIQNSFDLILIDAPCSGEGMFRKDPQAINEWSVANINLCAERQRRIIADAWPALSPGGILIYSTCTYNTKENEDNVLWIASELGGEILRIPAVPDSWEITGSLKHGIPAYRFLPHKTKGEGFFLAVIRKNSGQEEPEIPVGSERKKDRKVRDSSKTSIPFNVYSWLKNPESYHFFEEKNRIFAFPQSHWDRFSALKEQMRIVHAGIPIGEIKGKDIIPEHGLSLSVEFCRESFPSLELDKDQIIQFLRREAIFNLPETCSKGYLLVTFKDAALGFVKNIGNRANNLYPGEWRIRS